MWVRVPKVVGNSRQELRVFWGKTDAKDEIALDFGQPMTWADETEKDIHLDDARVPISEGKVAGNIITLKLRQPSTARTIPYLSGQNWDGKPASLIFGANAIAALTFYDVVIALP